NLPAFIEIMPGVPKSTSSAFLPARYGGTAIGRPDEKAQDRSWDNIGGVGSPEKNRLSFIEKLNHSHEQHDGPNAALDAEIQNMELAFRMQSEAPDVMAIENESAATQ